MQAHKPLTDPRARAVLALLAEHAHVEPGRVRPDLSADELGLAGMQLALALYEIEDRFGIELPPASGRPTVGELVQQVLNRAGAAH